MVKGGTFLVGKEFAAFGTGWKIWECGETRGKRHTDQDQRPARVTRASRFPLCIILFSCFRDTKQNNSLHGIPSRLVSQPHVLSHAGQDVAACCLLVEGARMRVCACPFVALQTFSQTWLFLNRETNCFLKFVLIRSHFPTQSWVYLPFHPLYPLFSHNPGVEERDSTSFCCWCQPSEYFSTRQKTRLKRQRDNTTKYSWGMKTSEMWKSVDRSFLLLSFVSLFLLFACLLFSEISIPLFCIHSSSAPFVLFCLHNFLISPYLLVRWLNEVELANKRETHRCKKNKNKEC